jgi:hypothetical protein
MPRIRKLFTAAVASLAGRVGLSVGIAVMAITSGYYVYAGLPQGLHLAAENASIQEQANEKGISFHEFQQQAYATCAQRFKFPNIEPCENAIFYGDFGELYEKNMRTYTIEYVAEVLMGVIFFGIAGAFAGWATVALFVPVIRRYCAWLVGGPPR